MSQLDVSHHPAARSRNVTAVLGPTNTGKTHLAIDRMLGHQSGIIGLPLRLLAREVYERIAERVGPDQVALVTGEEKIKPDAPRYWVATVEAMPRDLEVAFVAVDEVQLAADLERGHVFTDRMLRMRGQEETLLLGADTMRPILTRLMPGLNVIGRPRLSQLTYAGEKKITRLPRRSAIVAFSAEEVYAIAELIRRQCGGAAVVLGALSPRTRNAQVGLYQSGDVDFLVATDAIGMGLNLDVNHVAFASKRKFDGWQFRDLTPAEMGQVAGRAGRHIKDGTFGVTGRVDPLDPEVVERLEGHDFEPVRVAQWRNPNLDFSSLDALRDSLAAVPSEDCLTRAPGGDDVTALDSAANDPDVRDMARSPAAVERLWDVCQVPDYRKIAPANHAELAVTLYRHLMEDGGIPDDWFARQVAYADRIDGDLDTLSNRIAHIRTWTFVANRPDWLADPLHWQGTTRAVEDRLSDALHERLAQRFVDRRTSVLARRLRENTALDSEIDSRGDVMVEGQHVGRLEGLRFTADSSADEAHRKAISTAARKTLAGELIVRAEALAATPDDALDLTLDGAVLWQGAAVGRLEKGDSILGARPVLIADELLAGAPRQKAEERLSRWLSSRVSSLLGPLVALETDDSLAGMARGLAFQIGEALGVLERARIADEVRNLSQNDRAGLRRHGVRFGAHHIYVPALLKPTPRIFAAQLWALHHGGLHQPGFAELAALAQSGRMSVAVEPGTARGLYRALGYRPCGGRAIRVDILERLADLIRAALAWKPESETMPPAAAVDGRVFTVSEEMTSLAGCAGDDFAEILRSLGYRSETRPNPAAAPASESASSIDDEATPGAKADVPIEEPDQAAAVTQAAEADGEAVAGEAQEAPEAAAKREIAAEITVWRPARRPNASRKPRRAARADGLQRQGEGSGKKPGRKRRPGGEKQHVPRTAKPAKPAKPREPDPLSPFAALAALRDELAGRDER